MKHTEKEILDALMVLYETCDALDCDDCPLRAKDYKEDGQYEKCYLKRHNPSCYHIIDLPDSRPRRLFNN